MPGGRCNGIVILENNSGIELVIKLNRHLPRTLSTIPLKRYLIYPREIKTYGHIKTCTQMFTDVYL